MISDGSALQVGAEKCSYIYRTKQSREGCVFGRLMLILPVLRRRSANDRDASWADKAISGGHASRHVIVEELIDSLIGFAKHEALAGPSEKEEW